MDQDKKRVATACVWLPPVKAGSCPPVVTRCNTVAGSVACCGSPCCSATISEMERTIQFLKKTVKRRQSDLMSWRETCILTAGKIKLLVKENEELKGEIKNLGELLDWWS